MLADRINSYKKSQECIDKSIKHPTPAQYKAEFLFLKEVDCLALANAQMNLNKAYANFFRDKSTGFPKFKSKKDNHHMYTTNWTLSNFRDAFMKEIDIKTRISLIVVIVTIVPFTNGLY